MNTALVRNYKIEEKEPCKIQIDIEVSKEAVSDTFNAVYRDINKEVTIPGFRKGKAPNELLERYYLDSAQKEAIKRLISASYPRIADEEGLDLVGAPKISDAYFGKDGSLFYKANVETYPKIRLPKYKGLIIKKASIDVTEQDLLDALRAIAEAHAQIEQDKQRKVPSIDDEFAKDLGFGNIEELKKKVKDELLVKKNYMVTQQMKEQLFGQLLKDSSFKLPKDFLNRQRQYHKERMRARMLLSGMKEDEIDTKITQLEAKMDEDVSEQIKLFFILEEIAKKEALTVTEEELTSRLNELAAKWKTDIDNVRKYFDKNGLWGELIAELKHSKVVTLLFGEAKVDEGVKI